MFTTLTETNREVLTVEYKINFLAPAWGRKMLARGEVLAAGRRLFVCKAEVVPSLAREKRRRVRRCSKP